MDSIRDKLAENRLRWFGHVSRMQSDDVVKKVWRWDSEAKLNRGRPEQTWNAVVKKDMKKRGLVEEWAQDRGEWNVRSVSLPLLDKETGDDDDYCLFCFT